MGTLIFWIVVIGTSIWMAFDAKQIGYDKKDVKGFAGMSPVGWFFGGLLLWIVAFPLYLASRSKLKAAASAGTSMPTGGMGQVAEAASNEGTEPGTGDGKASMSPLRQQMNTAVGIFFGGWAVLALGWNLIGTEPDASPAATPTEPAVAQSAVPERASEPSAEYKALVAKIMAPNTLGAPMALDAAGLQKYPAHGEMLNMLYQATSESPQSDRISELNAKQTFAMVYFDCYGDECARRQAKRGGLRLPAKDKAEASAKAQVNTRCAKTHQNDGEWPREVFECVIGEYSALIELKERMSGNTGDIAEIQRLDSCWSRFIRGNKARFAEANACVANAQNGPPVGYSFVRIE